MSTIKSEPGEVAKIQQLERKPIPQRLLGYLALSGPGFLQGAMTLGGGSAIASLAIGANFGYEYLWVQPISMIIGCIMLFALSYQTLSTGERPYVAMRTHIGKWLPLLWALAAIASSVIWGFAQYPIGAGMMEDIVLTVTGFEIVEKGSTPHQLYLFFFACIIYFFVALTAWNYSRGGTFVRVVERTLQVMIGLIVICFALVVISASLKGRIDWAGVLMGFVPNSFPSDSKSLTTMMGALGAAVGINMTFVYGYTLLSRGWGRAHRTLSRYDIILGLVIPYALVVSLISIACASGIYPLSKPLEVEAKLIETEARLKTVEDPIAATYLYQQFAEGVNLFEEARDLAENDAKFSKTGKVYREAEAIFNDIGKSFDKSVELPIGIREHIQILMRARDDLIKPVAAAQVFAKSGLGDVFGRIVFSIGILGMVSNALIMHMLCCGFAYSEIFGVKIGSMQYRLSCLMTTPAVLGVFFWHIYGMYIGLITSTICAFLLPIAYVGWLVMNNKRQYLGNDCPTGRRRLAVNIVMGTCIFVVITALSYTTYIKIISIMS